MFILKLMLPNTDYTTFVFLNCMQPRRGSWPSCIRRMIGPDPDVPLAALSPISLPPWIRPNRPEVGCHYACL